MITNERQYAITKAKAEQFRQALAKSGRQGLNRRSRGP